MAIFDMVVILILLGYTVAGFRNGMFHEVLGLIGVTGGILAGIFLAGPISHWLVDYIAILPPILMLVMCFILLFLGVFYLIRSIANALKSAMDSLRLTWVNKGLGGLAGIFKGALIISLVLMLISFAPFVQKVIAPYEKKSVLHEPLHNLVPNVYKWLGSRDYLPEKIHDILEKSREELLDEAIENLKEDVEEAIDESFE